MKKAILIITIIITALIAWVVIFPKNNPLKKLFTKKQDDPANPATPATPNGAFLPTQPTAQPAGFPLTEGSRGLYVSNLQQALNARFGSSLVVDGIFGAKTYKAVSAAGYNANYVTYSDYLEILG